MVGCGCVCRSGERTLLTVEPASGRAGRSSFTLKAKTNPSLGARNATVTVTCGGESRTIAVSQPAGEGVEVTPDGARAGVLRYGDPGDGVP